MHERNIYKTPPNFADLAKKFDFLAPYLTVDVRGIPRINFKDDAALRALSRALLLQDFGLDVRIPERVLVPTVPLRLNYILWIEDILGFNVIEENVRGLDIGTGATAVYALLGAKKNKWKMTGTEVDEEYFQIATENVDRNGLSELVQIAHGSKESILRHVVAEIEDGFYTFTMCNPPFFASDEETDSVSKGRYSAEDKPLRPPPSAAKTGQKTELIAEGGELEFIRKMIRESVQFPLKVKIYTTMVGLKRHLKQLTSELKSNGIVNYTTTEFSQGKTMRWGFAWSLYPGVQLFPGHPDIISVFSNFSTLLNFESLISSYLSELKLHTMKWLPVSPTEPEAPPCLEVVATSNTWSHQRRRRREMERQQGKSSPGEGPSPTKTRRTSEGSSAEMECDDDDLSGEMAVASSSETKDEDETILIHFLMDFVREGEDAKLILRYRGGCLGKDGMNQILQFLKNRFAKDCRDPESFVCQIASSS